MVVAIDGPAERARARGHARKPRMRSASRISIPGAMYRAVGLMTLRHGGAASDQAEKLELQLGERVVANGED